MGSQGGYGLPISRVKTGRKLVKMERKKREKNGLGPDP